MLDLLFEEFYSQSAAFPSVSNMSRTEEDSSSDLALLTLNGSVATPDDPWMEEMNPDCPPAGPTAAGEVVTQQPVMHNIGKTSQIIVIFRLKGEFRVMRISQKQILI